MAKDFSIGMVEVSGLGDAIIMLDDMCKVADVEFVATERKLGGRLVTIVVRGELTAVKASVDAGEKRARELGSFKASQVIARPHDEILPYLHLDKEDTEEKKEPTKAEKKPEAKSAQTTKTAAKTTRRTANSRKTATKKTAETK